MTDTVKLRKLIDNSGLKYKFIAEKMSLSPYGFQKKVDGLLEFKQSEIVVLCKILKITSLKQMEEIFFAKKVE